ncbi:MAG: hypothetical protein K2N83_01845 [Eubacterium sp.]|nr:hypothetical protein [Eubacterium sp.]
MINTELVKASIMLMGDFEEDEIEKFSPVISSAVSATEAAIKEDADDNDPRVVQLAAAKAYHAICCSASQTDGITSFSAGDVSVTQKTDILSNAESYYEMALNDCRALLRPESVVQQAETNGFAFLGV